MIANRVKLEREIIRGRRSVRRALQRDRPGPDSDGITHAVEMSRKQTQGIEELPIESEAEQDFARGSQRFFKRIRSPWGKGDPSPRSLVPTPAVHSQADNIRHRVLNSDEDADRRPRLDTTLSYGGTADDESGPLPQTGEVTPPASPIKASPVSFFARLQPQNFRPMSKSFGSSRV